MSYPQEPLPIFAKLNTFILWLVPMTNHFPRQYRGTITKRLVETTFDLQERLLEANQRRAQERLERLRASDELLVKVQFYVRQTHQLRWMTLGQYEHASRMLDEIGRLLGGWQKITNPSSGQRSTAKVVGVAGAD